MFEFFRQIRELLESLAQSKSDSGASNRELYKAEIAFPYFDKEAEHQAGQVVRDKETGQLCKCIQGYKGAEHPDVDLNTKSMWMKYHGLDENHAYPFEHPTMAEDTYKTGEFCTFEGQVCEALENTSYSPAEYPAHWKIHDVKNS